MHARTPSGARGAAFLTVALCCLVAMMEGIDLQAPGLTAPVLGSLFKMTAADKGWFLSMSTFGLMAGAAIGGRLSDLLGRKGVLVLSVSLFGLFSLATAASSSAPMLMAMRFLTGLGLGGTLPNLIALAVETISDGRRHTAIGFLYASMPFGGGAASLITALASRPGQWPIIYLVGGIAPLLVAPLLIRVLPAGRPASRKAAAGPGGALAALFGEGRAARSLLLWASFFGVLLTMYLLLGWLPTLMVSRGLSHAQASTVQLAFNWLGALGSIATGVVLDRGRRVLSTGLVFAATAGALACLAATPGRFGLALLAAGFTGVAISGTQAVLYALAPACYPARSRGTGVGAAVAMGRLGSAAGPLLAGALVGAGRSPGQVLIMLVPIVAVSAVGAVSVAWMARARPVDAAPDA
jgi:AAHS family 3-hydroxyphenylpropionic acid transporter